MQSPHRIARTQRHRLMLHRERLLWSHPVPHQPAIRVSRLRLRLFIGLLPGLEAFHRIQFALSSLHKFRSKPALHNKLARFAYLRHGNPPRAEVQAEAQVDFPTTTYLHLPHCANATPIKPEIKTRDGAMVLYNERIIVVKNDDDLGDAVRWWRAANSAVNCSRTSSAVEFGEKAQVIRAFELIAELAMIGDMVLLYHSASLKRYVGSSETVRQAVYTTPGRVYSLVVRQLGLLED